MAASTLRVPSPHVIGPLWRRLTRGQQVTLVLVSIGNTVAAVSVVLPSVIIGQIVTVLTANATTSITNLIWLLAALLALFVVLKVVIHISLHNILPRVEASLREAQLERTLKTPVLMDTEENQYAAELNSLMGKGAMAGRDTIQIVFNDLMPAVMQAAVAAITAFTTQWQVGVVLIASGVVSTAITQFQLRSQGGVRVAINRAKARLDGIMTELLRGKAVIRTLNAADAESQRVGKRALELSAVEVRHHKMMGLFDAAKNTSESAFSLVVLVIAAGFVVAGASAGLVLTLYLLFMQFATPLRDIHRIRDELNESSLQLGEVFRILGEPIDPIFDTGSATPSSLATPSGPGTNGLQQVRPAADSPSGHPGTDTQSTRTAHHRRHDRTHAATSATPVVPATEPGSDKHSSTPVHADVTIDHVSVTYPDGTEAVHDVSVEVPDGSYLGICGPAGCGKSTLIKALVRILPPSAGRILIGYTDTATMDIDQLTSTIAYVSQEPYVVSGTIRDNLLLGQPEPLPDVQLTGALTRVGLLDEIGGLDTTVGEDGLGLSGGQRQRLVLARILLRPAAVIVLDEATSALDNINEEHFMQALETSNRTIIAIAHRLSTLRKANHIIVMSDGRIVETGTYDSLDAKEGLFHDLLHAGEDE